MDNYLGEIRIFGFNYAPRSWALCNGQLVAISQNTALFSLLGTYYGGDGRSTFALPNLQAAVPIHEGQGTGLSPYFVGESGGTPTVTLATGQMPAHNHSFLALEGGRGGVKHANPGNGDTITVATPPGEAYIAPGTPNAAMNPAQLGLIGGGAAHNNMMPSLVLSYCIALTGIYPPRS